MKKYIRNGLIYIQPTSPAEVLSKLGLAVSVVLILLGLVGLILVRDNLDKPQDIRQQASVQQGKVLVVAAPTTAIKVNQTSKIQFTVNTQELQVDGVQLVFNLISDSPDGVDIQVLPNSGFQTAYSEVQSTADGWLIGLIAVPKTIGSGFSSNSPVPFVELSFTPMTTGTLKLAFDQGNSLSIVHNSVPPKDELRTLTDVNLVIEENVGASPLPTPTPSPTPSPGVSPSPTTTQNDFYFPALADRNNVFWFYEVGTRTSVASNQLVPSKTFVMEIPYTVQNAVKTTSSDTRSVGINIYQNNQLISSATTAYAATVTSAGAAGTLSTTFTAQSSNTFRISVDPNNDWSESSESNNSFEKTFTYVGTGGVTYRSCNESCSSNSECGTNYRCYQNRCRLVTNVSDSTCSTTTSSGLQRRCNEYCADSRECASGFTCFYNKCRLPENPDEASCVAPTTYIVAAIGQSCNQSCGSNQDCGVNLRCYNGACRLATNPGSASCSPATTDTLSGLYQTNKGGGAADQTESASSGGTLNNGTNTGTSSATMSPKPSSKTTPAKDTSGSDTQVKAPGDMTLLERLQQLLPSSLGSSQGSSLPQLALLVGGGLLALILIFWALSRIFGGGRSSSPTMVVRPPLSGEYEHSLQNKIQELTAQNNQKPTEATANMSAMPPQTLRPAQNLRPPQAVRPAAPQQPSTLAQPSVSTRPSAPAQPPLSSTRPAPYMPAAPSGVTPPPPTSSMLQRIQTKGVQPPGRVS